MKYSNLSEKRKQLINKTIILDIDGKDDIIYHLTGEIVPDSMLYNFFEFNNI